MEEHEFLIPDYYLSFRCKMGACRSACCVGWPVSISMRNYFYLLGLNCRDDLRKRIDCGLRIVDFPTEEEYARFEPRYDGDCPLRMSDGRCSLHAELGEDILPDSADFIREVFARRIIYMSAHAQTAVKRFLKC